MFKIKNFFSQFFKKKEFVLTRASEEKNVVSTSITKEQAALKIIETALHFSLLHFPDFVNAGVVLDSRLNKVGYDAHAAFTIPNNDNPFFISIAIDDIDDCFTQRFSSVISAKFADKMLEVKKQS